MKNLILLLALTSTLLINAQAFEGKGDTKFQVGLNVQDNGSGLNLSYDYGIGENISIGLSSTYLLGVDEDLDNVYDVDFSDRIDLKARFNANLGNVINVSDNFDLYPGLSLSFKNFGGHVGARYFFTEGFGVYSELNFPLATYDENLNPAEKLNNQVTINIGASFNL
ncbi:DUF6646 family protein [Neotamlana laminarinivorans]|uniref:Outer membrane protein beta-barrel domain-containing protein n=1 Tax=Neotamlana laminarinivorans TaxID=2883124 RepID=A0A9X1L471_9FLAO|nr:DUF6646 family protein [Tamlana laminarinivorans]MCB4798011.1 hypothetical protein [Tamlana laminarinivorans]